MSDDTRTLLLDSLTRVLQDHCTPERVQAADGGGFDAPLWALLEELGFGVAILPESRGGIGADVADLLEILRVAAGYAAPVPLAETVLLAPWLCQQAGLTVPAGIATVIDSGLDLPAQQQPAGGRPLEGGTLLLPAGRWADTLVVCARAPDGAVVGLVPCDSLELEAGMNLAGEARDRLDAAALHDFGEQGVAVDAAVAQNYLRLAALARAAQLTGAMEAALSRSVQYAAERQQFGRPLAKFQAVQQQLAIAAAEVAACQAAVASAARNFGQAGGEFAVAAAKIRTGEAAAQVSRIAHQVHGAMGFTQEYPLHHLTRRLWAWRDEFGSEQAWANRLGSLVAQRGEVWHSLTALG